MEEKKKKSNLRQYDYTILMRSKISRLLLDSGLSEYKLSEQIGKSRGYIQSITSGKSNPSFDSLLDICDYFGITPGDLFAQPPEEISLKMREAQGELMKVPEQELTTLIEVIKKFQ